MPLKIGALAARTGASAPTIRYYEEIGLLPAPSRREGGQRTYDQDDVKRLTFIRRCREFGLPIGKVRELVALMHDPGRSCTDVRDLAQEHLLFVRAKLAELRALERSIAGFVQSSEGRCPGGSGPECVILE